ncbi:uncharacterized protein LOC115713654 [Cannabis sativa]|uniref:uncharacterized protein LOC115713654 n=1 Tax=Cannabis sativa TaxID=3483 RepID=UPI0011E0075A|nr:uncharacterized protein LOC115713654 [Cannabis sativa]
MLWRVLAGCIPVKENIAFIKDKGCVLCEEGKESLKHVFWDCPFARALWFSGMFPVVNARSTGSDLMELIHFFLQGIPMNDKWRFLTFVDCLFEEVWRMRNAVLFKSNRMDILLSRVSISKRLEEFYSIQEEQPVFDTNIKRAETYLSWKIPQSTAFVCFTDASWKQGSAGLAVGMVDRASSRSWWSAKWSRAASAIEAESLAIVWALQLAVEAGIQSIAVASDALLVVKAIVQDSFPPCWKAIAVFFEIRKLVKLFNSCSFVFIRRVDNEADDVVAKTARIDGHCNDFINREGSPFVIPNYLF